MCQQENSVCMQENIRTIPKPELIIIAASAAAVATTTSTITIIIMHCDNNDNAVYLQSMLSVMDLMCGAPKRNLKEGN